MVVIGHSQGGLLTKLTAIDSGTRFWDRVSSKPFEAIDVSPETRALLQQSTFFTPLPFVGRVIFVSTPHYGAIMAGRQLGRILAWLVTLPIGLTNQLAQAATLSRDDKLAALLRRPPTAVDNMYPRHPGLRMLASIAVPPQIPAHSIIAVEGDGPKEEGDDGVVTYRSAHIDEAASELVVRWNHSCQGQPEVIEEISGASCSSTRQRPETVAHDDQGPRSVTFAFTPRATHTPRCCSGAASRLTAPCVNLASHQERGILRALMASVWRIEPAREERRK